MTTPVASGPTLGTRAEEDLRYIRRTVESASAFTAVPGRGGMVMGFVALVAAAVAGAPDNPRRWITVWMVAAAVAMGSGLLAMRAKAARAGLPLRSAPARRFAMSMAAPLLAGAVLTPVLLGHGLVDVLPGTWLLLYGAGVVAAGVASISIVPATGAIFMLAGVAGLACPPGWANALMAVGFGGLHIGFGALIARRHGG